MSGVPVRNTFQLPWQIFCSYQDPFLHAEFPEVSGELCQSLGLCALQEVDVPDRKYVVHFELEGAWDLVS